MIKKIINFFKKNFQHKTKKTNTVSKNLVEGNENINLIKEDQGKDNTIETESVEQILEQLPIDVVKQFESLEKEYDRYLINGKKNLLIIDDNAGLVSLIEDVLEIESLKDKINVLKINSIYAGFVLHILKRKKGFLKIDYAVIDLSLGGVIYNDEVGNIGHEGIMVFKDIYENNKNVKFFFYTGNNLNPYVYASKKIITLFSEITNGKNILEYVIFKNQYPPSKLSNVLIKKLGLKNG